jgi:DNA-binding cell septation regulator SpoVG
MENLTKNIKNIDINLVSVVTHEELVAFAKVEYINGIVIHSFPIRKVEEGYIVEWPARLLKTNIKMPAVSCVNEELEQETNEAIINCFFKTIKSNKTPNTSMINKSKVFNMKDLELFEE